MHLSHRETPTVGVPIAALGRVILVAGLVLVISAVTLLADPPSPSEVDQLIRQLGSDRFEERETASKSLDGIGEPALAALRRAATGSSDAEVRNRANQLVRSIQTRVDQVDARSEPPPKGATVLFDGKGLDAWVQRDGRTRAAWKLLEDGAMEAGGGDIMTRQAFAGRFKLHVEFRVPAMPLARGQARGNSGVYVQGRYELQILDSYDLPCDPYCCGAVYGLTAPLANACKSPAVWQTFDIEFQAPKFEAGRNVEHARLTLRHNGVKIHDNVRISRPTPAGLPGDPDQPGPILLQDHRDPVEFRNLWLLPLPDQEGR